MKIDVLDHGYVRFVESWGHGDAFTTRTDFSLDTDVEAGIIEAARQSTQGSFRGWETDEKLLAYLYENKHCYDSETEVLTDRGFVRWPDVVPSDKLYTFDPTKNEAFYERPSALQYFDHSGPMYRVEHGGVDLLVTINHKMFVKTIERKPDGRQGWQRVWRLETANNLGDRSMVRYRKHARLGITSLPNFDSLGFGTIIDKFAFLEFVGFFIGDGNATGTRANSVSFHLKKDRKVHYLRSLCARLEWDLAELASNQFVVRGKNFRSVFSQFYDADGVKFMPRWATELPGTLASLLLEGMKNSDGTRKRGTWELSTTSAQVRDAVEILAVHAGESSSTYTSDSNGRVCYRIAFHSRMREPVINQGQRNTSVTEYTGKVYCATTRTGVLLVRRNGKVVLSGNSTPFEFAGCVIEVQAPIFVFREWHRHRTQSYNEMSARYEPLPDLYYVPTVERLMRNAGGTNKQAGTVKGSGQLTEEYARATIQRRIARYREFEADYQQDLANGVPKEIARDGMPVSHYTRMRATANLRNWLAFLTLRTAPNAQWEIQEFARAVQKILEAEFPRTMRLFNVSHG